MASEFREEQERLQAWSLQKDRHWWVSNTTLGELIGQGSYGKVLAAVVRDPFGGQEARVAVKVVAADRVDYAELDLLSRVHHPFMLRAYKISLTRSADESHEFFIWLPLGMEFQRIAGNNLFSLPKTLASTVLNPEHVLHESGLTDKMAIAQTAIALHFLHEHGFAHCDVKGSNILISGDGEKVLLSDFGLTHRSSARSYRACQTLMAPENLVDYMKFEGNWVVLKEAIRRYPKELDSLRIFVQFAEQKFSKWTNRKLEKSDVWALGMMLLSIHNGGLKRKDVIGRDGQLILHQLIGPWETDRLAEVEAMFRIERHTTPLLRTKRIQDMLGVPTNRASLLEKMLRVDPANRPSLIEVIKHLGALQLYEQADAEAYVEEVRPTFITSALVFGLSRLSWVKIDFALYNVPRGMAEIACRTRTTVAELCLALDFYYRLLCEPEFFEWLQIDDFAILFSKPLPLCLALIDLARFVTGNREPASGEENDTKQNYILSLLSSLLNVKLGYATLFNACDTQQQVLDALSLMLDASEYFLRAQDFRDHVNKLGLGEIRWDRKDTIFTREMWESIQTSLGWKVDPSDMFRTATPS